MAKPVHQLLDLRGLVTHTILQGFMLPFAPGDILPTRMIIVVTGNQNQMRPLSVVWHGFVGSSEAS